MRSSMIYKSDIPFLQMTVAEWVSDNGLPSVEQVVCDDYIRVVLPNTSFFFITLLDDLRYKLDGSPYDVFFIHFSPTDGLMLSIG